MFLIKCLIEVVVDATLSKLSHNVGDYCNFKEMHYLLSYHTLEKLEINLLGLYMQSKSLPYLETLTHIERYIMALKETDTDGGSFSLKLNYIFLYAPLERLI